AQFSAANPDARSAAGALAQLYVERKRYAEARTVFQRLWDGDRSAREFEFGVAVISMQMKDWDKAESLFNDLRRANYGDNGVVELKPEDAQSLNALGYTLVDRTPRTAEGLALIERAHKLSPDDPFILDSMGWAMFKLGRHADAERYLRRAMEERPDAEIAAHL